MSRPQPLWLNGNENVFLGIGGVHRGAEYNFDISADLNELGSSNVAVICSGVKSILDIPKTLEYLVGTFQYASEVFLFIQFLGNSGSASCNFR